MLRGGEEVISKAVIWKDLAQVMSLLLELEKERPDPRIARARQLIGKAIKELDKLPVPGSMRTV
jgi:hypothetical protein